MAPAAAHTPPGIPERASWYSAAPADIPSPHALPPTRPAAIQIVKVASSLPGRQRLAAQVEKKKSLPMPAAGQCTALAGAGAHLGASKMPDEPPPGGAFSELGSPDGSAPAVVEKHPAAYENQTPVVPAHALAGSLVAGAPAPPLAALPRSAKCEPTSAGPQTPTAGHGGGCPTSQRCVAGHPWSAAGDLGTAVLRVTGAPESWERGAPPHTRRCAAFTPVLAGLATPPNEPHNPGPAHPAPHHLRGRSHPTPGGTALT